MPNITVEVIANKEFSIKPRGYDQEEVDTFLDEICDEMEQMLKNISQLQQQLREAQAQANRPVQSAPAAPAPSPVDASESSLREILLMAQKVKDETIADARKKADEIIENAQKKAEDQLGAIASERDSLTRQVEALRETAKDYKSRFAALISQQQEALQKINDL
ncbi:MAG: DivIVA domain-containing protein [Clostridia bacterium]|nr:DivIVA domain-containing protein [Clostridia bacterium]